MKKRQNIFSLILKLDRKPEGASKAYEEEPIGYEAFPSRYLDKVLKNYHYSMRFFDKAEKISSTDL
jgi:hypothetical protein